MDSDNFAIVSLSGTLLHGVRFRDGTPEDWQGFMARRYHDVTRATTAARRKYSDQSINVTECENFEGRYRVPFAELDKYKIED